MYPRILFQRQGCRKCSTASMSIKHIFLWKRTIYRSLNETRNTWGIEPWSPLNYIFMSENMDPATSRGQVWTQHRAAMIQGFPYYSVNRSAHQTITVNLTNWAVKFWKFCYPEGNDKPQKSGRKWSQTLRRQWRGTIAWNISLCWADFPIEFL